MKLSNKKVGTIAYTTVQGLGILAKDFYDNGVVDKVSIQLHTSRKNNTQWYPNAVTKQELLEQCNTLLFFETPFDWKMIPMARERGIKTVLMPMYECTRYPFPYVPDLIIAPSMLDYDFYKEKGEANVIFIPVPVTATWKLRRKAEVFVHNAGNGGLGGRNGTEELIEAMKYVKSPIKLIIRTQSIDFKCDDPRVEIERGTVHHDELYSKGDVFIFPEKFNGLSLPLQEAYASGMLVMASNRYPMNTWLPNEPLIPVKEYRKDRISVEFDMAVIDPRDIANTIDAWYGKDISQLSLDGRDWAKNNSWHVLRDRYLDVL